MPDSATYQRDLVRGSLVLMVLSLLVEGARHGYAVQQGIRDACGHTIQAGTLYPLLHQLESDGLLRATWDRSTNRPRKIYAITAAGRRRLRSDAKDWSTLLQQLQQLIEPAVQQIATS